jgi:hypothetical protein
MLINTEYNVHDHCIYLINGAKRNTGTIMSIDIHIDSTGAITEHYNIMSNTLSNKNTHNIPSYDIILSTTAISRSMGSKIERSLSNE